MAMAREIRQILAFMAFGTGLFIGLYAVVYSAVPAALVCVFSLAFAARPSQTSSETAAPSPEFASMPASREDRFLVRVNTAFAARRHVAHDYDGPTFGNVEHRGQRR